MDRCTGCGDYVSSLGNPTGACVTCDPTAFKYSIETPDDWGVEIVEDPTTYEQALDLVLAEMRELLIERHKKYGAQNILRGGVHGLITRMNDKIARIEMDHSKCLFNECTWHSREMTDEEAEDAWLDLSCYSGPIGLMLQRGWWELSLE